MQLNAAQGVAPVGAHLEGVAMPVQPGLDLILVRNPEPAILSVWRSETFLILGVFWLLSVGLAWAVARGVVQPIRLLAQRLPHIESDPAATLPGAERSDELGELARAYLGAREQIGIERAKRQQSERMALLGRMATGLAHEIHNPLSAIQMHAQLLKTASGAEFPVMAAEFVPTLLEETGRIESLVNQWMFLTRPEPPACSALDIGALIAAGIRAQSGAAAHAAVSVRADAPEGLLVQGDKRRLSQAISNVIVNAIQAMRGGGLLRISATQAGEWVVVAFQDEGSGFSPAALERHRELFFSEKEGGMGIGLSVTGEILEAHNGRLEISNGPEGGAYVTFYLPANEVT